MLDQDLFLIASHGGHYLTQERSKEPIAPHIQGVDPVQLVLSC